MKKTPSKAPKTPTKAKTAPVEAKPVAAKLSALAKTVAPKVSKAKLAEKPVKQASAPVVPVAKAPAPEAILPTQIVAQVDIGFGNQLFVRGEGAGLSWEKGLPMANVAADRWQVTLQAATAPIVFKFLINDVTWSVGDDHMAAPGSTVTLVPLF